jgi:hypothetical protein
MTNIYELRNIEMDPALAAKLFPFVNAYRPHSPAPTWRELKDSGLEKIENESMMNVIEEQYLAESSVGKFSEKQ